MITISVIGISGRNSKVPLTIQHFEFMCNKLIEFIKENELDLNNIQLVSGGQAWGDHVAVDTFLKYSNQLKLKLYLPCEICKSSNKINYEFKDTGVNDWRTNPGKLSNKCHKSFQDIVKRNTINEIIKARDLGAIIDSTSKGFHSRNTKVSKSDYIIAFTFSTGDAPECGGTLDTFRKSKSKNKYHFTIPTNFNNISNDNSNVLNSDNNSNPNDNNNDNNKDNNNDNNNDNNDNDNNNNINNITPTSNTTILTKRGLENEEKQSNKRFKKDTKITDYFTKQ